MGLIDVGFSRLLFTLYSKRTTNDAIFGRPYRARPNYQWIELYLTATLRNLPLLEPDHAPYY